MKITHMTVSSRVKIGMPGYSNIEHFASATAELSEDDNPAVCLKALQALVKQQLALEFGELLEARVDVAFAQNDEVKKKWLDKQTTLAETYAAIFPELQGLWRNDKSELNKLRLSVKE